MKTVKLITCSDAAQAHIIQGALENEGISSLLHNENMSTLLRGYINDIAGWTFWSTKPIMKRCRSLAGTE